MTANLAWEHVVNDDADFLEFGACHENVPWRTHKTDQTRFQGLQSAFATSNHRLTRLLLDPESNSTARNNPGRGQALFAAVWSSHHPWAILCSPEHAVLVPKTSLAAFSDQPEHGVIASRLRELIHDSPAHLKTHFDHTFYDRKIAPNR